MTVVAKVKVVAVVTVAKVVKAKVATAAKAVIVARKETKKINTDLSN